MANEEYILKHYRKIAKNFGLSGESTIQDQYIRQSEVKFFLTEIDTITQDNQNCTILDLGCGNGYLLEQIRLKYPKAQLFGVEFTPELCDLAQSRHLNNCEIIHGSIKDSSIVEKFTQQKFDIIITERVIINLLSWKQQRVALENISTWLNSGGHYLFSESFRDSLINLNRARSEFSLPQIEISKHNLYLTRRVERYLNRFNLFKTQTTLPETYLSTHFYMTRVVHFAIRPVGGRRKDSRFADFFNQALPPGVGDYSPILFFHYLKNKNSEK
jgi:SAM-dependent methyltransferase